MSLTLTDPLGVQDDIKLEVTPYDDKAPGDGKTHIVNPPLNQHIWIPGMTAQEIVDIARNTEQPVKALCGYTWVPKRNPEKYPACDSCVRIAHDLMRGQSE